MCGSKALYCFGVHVSRWDLQLGASARQCISTGFSGTFYVQYVLCSLLAAAAHHRATGSSTPAMLVYALGAWAQSIPSRYRGEGAETPGVVDTVAKGAIEGGDEGFSPLFHQGFICVAGK